IRTLTRDLMLFHVRGRTDPVDRIRQIRALAHDLLPNVPTENNPYGQLLRKDLEKLIIGTTDSRIAHDVISEVNDPVYFYQFVEHAQYHGLQYLGEAEFGAMSCNIMPQQMQAAAVTPE